MNSYGSGQISKKYLFIPGSDLYYRYNIDN